MNKLNKLLIASALVLFAGMAAAQETKEANPLARLPSADGAKVSFAELKDGDVVSTTFMLRFELEGMEVAPAGDNTKNSGHHHLLIDVEELPDFSLPLPKSENVQHFGGGQTEAEITLSPGRHTLQLVLGDYLHIPHNPPVMSEKITVIVEEVQ